GRLTLRRFGVGVLGLFGLVLGLGPDELHFAREDLEARARLLGLRIGPALLLQRAADEDLAALLEELGADLGEPAPGDDVDERDGLGFLSVALRVVMVGRDAEGADRRPAGRVLQFRVPG